MSKEGKHHEDDDDSPTATLTARGPTAVILTARLMISRRLTITALLNRARRAIRRLPRPIRRTPHRLTVATRLAAIIPAARTARSISM
jgi:hypothetical protein